MTTLTLTYGAFTATGYQTTLTDGGSAALVGATIDLTFMPSDTKADLVDKPIGLVQACKVTRPGIPLAEQLADEPLLLARINASPSEWYIDQYSYAKDGKKISEEDAKNITGKAILSLVPQTNPVYNSLNVTYEKLAKTLRDNTGENTFGRIYSSVSGLPARLNDAPSRTLIADSDATFRQEFETAAVTLTSPSRYIGSVRWGYTAQRQPNNKYVVATIPFATVSNDRPSATFFGAAAAWNGQKLVDYSINEKIARVAVPL